MLLIELRKDFDLQAIEFRDVSGSFEASEFGTGEDMFRVRRMILQPLLNLSTLTVPFFGESVVLRAIEQVSMGMAKKDAPGMDGLLHLLEPKRFLR